MQQQIEVDSAANLAADFRILADKWELETGLLSSTTQIAAHPAYREIVAMGEAAVPLILGEMQTNPGHWTLALRAITGENPAPRSMAGRDYAVAEVWLEWGRRKGYIS